MNELTVFFSPLMCAPSESYSPSAEKPASAVASWQRLGVPLVLRAPDPMTVEQLALAHDPAWVRDVLAGRADNGFGNRSPLVAAALPYTSGALLAAARHALSHEVAIAPCSGFHHAGYRAARGFCTFNGLMATAAVLHAEGYERIGILDCDQHYGDGTDEIIRALDARFVHHVTIGARYDRVDQAELFLRELPSIVRGFADCDVVLYQAGADAHVADPLGGWLTTEQLRVRDAIVFEQLKAQGTPVAWDLAGGYQRDTAGTIRPVLDIHDHTLLECARVYGC